MVDLQTTYMGLRLAHPVVASASPLSKDTDGVKRLEDGGAAAVVMFSLFEEQIRHEQEALDHLSSVGTDSFAESLSYFPQLSTYKVGPDRYLELLRRAKQSVRIPVIASLNGTTRDGWVGYAKQMQQAGADAIELNVYSVAVDPARSPGDVEDAIVNLVREVKGAVSVPVAVKLGPHFTAFANMAKKLDEAGADALVLFNRFYQPDFDLDKLEVTPSLELSTPSEIRLPLLWIAVLAGRIRASLAATTGVHGGREVVKYIMAGADIAMTTSALLREGPGHAAKLVAELSEWMTRHHYSSVAQMRGAMSQQKVADPSAFERANYIKVLESYRNPFATS